METDSKYPTICLVCGGDAFHYNYGIPSCNSCKTFFRRCIVRNRTYKCKWGGNCNIEKSHKCKSCRLKLCHKLGMDPKMIDPTGRAGKAMIRKNSRYSPIHSTGPSSSSSPETHIVPAKIADITLLNSDSVIYLEINDLLYVESKLQRLRESNFSPGKLIFGSIEELLLMPTEIRNSERYQKLHPIHQISSIKEKLRLAVKFNQPLHTLRRFSLALDNLIVIEASKTLPCFSKLSLDDQIRLLKHICVVNTTLTQSFYSMQNGHSTLVMPDGTALIHHRLKQNQLLKNPVPQNLIEEVFSKVIDPLKRVQISKTEYVLLKTLTFCYAGIDGLSNYATTILQEESMRYSRILLKHLQIKLGPIKGAHRYLEVISLMGVYFQFSEKHRQLYLLRKIPREEKGTLLRMPQTPKLLDEIML